MEQYYFFPRNRKVASSSDFEMKVMVYCKRLFRFVYAKCHDEELSRDIVQETLVVAHRQINCGLYSERGLVWGWLMRIAGNMLMGHYRTEKRRADVVSGKKFRICENLGWREVSGESMDMDDQVVTSDMAFRSLHERNERIENMMPFLLQTEFSVLRLSDFERMLLKERHLKMKVFKEIANEADMPLSTLMSRYYTLMKKVRRQILDLDKAGFFNGIDWDKFGNGVGLP